jgi:outer membrane protein TolC
MPRLPAASRAIVLLGIAVLTGPAAPIAGAQLSLTEALRQADRSAYDNRVAAGTASERTALTLAPLQAILPNVRLEGAYARTTDPIGVFGNKLRQGTITQADFDPQRLSHPGAVGNQVTSVVLEQPVFNADAWAGLAAARHGADASQAVTTWVRLATRVSVVRAYYGAVLASVRTMTIRAAARSAHAHLSQTEAMVRQGMVTRSDALLAAVRAGDVDAQLATADGDAETARRRLAIALGLPQGDFASDATIPRELPSADRIEAVAACNASGSLESRADVRAAQQESAAAHSDALRARAAYLPHINSFARYDWNAANRLYAGERNWTVGVMATWNPFASATTISGIRAAGSRATVAQAQAERAAAQAELDQAQTRTALGIALTRLKIAEQSAAQSAEAHRIVSRKYEGGLASIVDLLDAQATETQSALGLSDARYNVIVAAAERCRALGADPAALAALDQDNATPAATTATSHNGITSAVTSATTSDAHRPY